MNNNVVALEGYAKTFIENKCEIDKIKEEDIQHAVEFFINTGLVTNISDEEKKNVIKSLESFYRITMDTGVMIKEDDYQRWYYNSRAERGTAHWDRYERYLKEVVKLSPNVIDKINDSSDEIMDVLGDPRGDTKIERKGLVIGAVQSGKTSNYIALMNKATDSGYSVIILLTGVLEKLRQQTQSRVDEGFVGWDSSLSRDTNNTPIGVGRYATHDKPINISPFTTTEKDFNVNTPLRIDNHKGTVVFVIKKNKSVLEKLEKWLRRHNADPETKKIEEFPLLLIDDEADNASINTNDPDKDPTAINQAIRNLLKLFTKYSYVGFTATPYANIFINPQLNKKVRDDLFPKDFIYLLDQPSNYIGPNAMYSETGKYHYMIRNNDDVEHVLPMKHKNNEYMSRIPRTLEDAILLFFIGNAVRDLRGQNKKHRSMLVHISRFISVQNNIQEKIDGYVKDTKMKIKNYSLLENEIPLMTRMRELYEVEYGIKNIETDESTFPIPETWEDIKLQLYKSIDPIQVKSINKGSASKYLNYDEYSSGLRLIAVGGLSLARGLTLEGLMISYFYRNTKMYDTLMQMGRWFGYREGYADLCRLWTSEESAGWYAHIADATEELKMEIRMMADQGMKPDDFGLKVRSSEDAALIATARNKMRTGQSLTLKRSVNGQVIETPILSSKREELEANNLTIENWFVSNKKYAAKVKLSFYEQNPNLKNVPKSEIINLLEELEFPYLNDSYIASMEPTSEKLILKDLRETTISMFDNWDVVIASNKDDEQKEKIKFAGEYIIPVERSFDFFGSKDFIRISGSKKKLGSVEYAKAGLTEEQYGEIAPVVKEAQGDKKSPSARMYFNTGKRRNPLLVIYPVYLKKVSEKKSPKKKPLSEVDIKKIDDYVDSLNMLVTGISIGIPNVEGVKTLTHEYVINIIAQKELMEYDPESSKEYDDTQVDD